MRSPEDSTRRDLVRRVCRSPPGRPRVPIYASDAPVFDDNGKLIAIIGASHDITGRKNAEELLRKSTEQFRSVLDNSLDVIYRRNLKDGRFEYISPSVDTIVGFSPDELKAKDTKTSLAMVHPDDLPAMKAALSYADKHGRAEVEYRQRTRTGDYRWLSDHISVIRDSTGRPLYRDGTIRDITENKLAEEELKRRHNDLNAAYEEIASTQEELRAEYRRARRAGRTSSTSPCGKRDPPLRDPPPGQEQPDRVHLAPEPRRLVRGDPGREGAQKRSPEPGPEHGAHPRDPLQNTPVLRRGHGGLPHNACRPGCRLLQLGTIR